MRRYFRLSSFVAMVGLLTLLTGCPGEGGPKKVSVKGTITKGGAAITVPADGIGTIIFTEVKGADQLGDATYPGTIDAAGAFQINVPLGKYFVSPSVLDKDRNSTIGPPVTNIVKEVTGPTSDMKIEIP